MNKRAQIFSIDFVIAMVLIILGIGLLLGVAQIKAFEAKEENSKQILSEKAEAALISLSGMQSIQCSTDKNIYLPFSVDTTKLANRTSTQTLVNIFKKELGLQDFNINLGTYNSSGESLKVSEVLSTSTIFALDANILVCTKTIAYSDINACINKKSACDANISEQKIILRVSK